MHHISFIHSSADGHWIVSTFGLLWMMLLWIFQFSLVTQSCPTLYDPMDCSTPGFPVHHQLLEPAQTHLIMVAVIIKNKWKLGTEHVIRMAKSIILASNSVQGKLCVCFMELAVFSFTWFKTSAKEVIYTFNFQGHFQAQCLNLRKTDFNDFIL